MPDIINLKIAELIIQLSFKSIPRESTYFFMREKIENEILEYCKGFTVDQKVKKIDFFIDFVSKYLPEIIGHKNKKRKAYFFLYEESGVRRFVTSCRISIFQFQLILIDILYKLLFPNKGILIHASAVFANNKAFLFLGKSEAGKSTIMRFLSKNYRPLADDSLIIKKENGDFYLYQTPFVEHERWVRKNNSGKYPIGRIFFLKKSKDFKAKKIKKEDDVVNELVKHILIVENSRDFQKYIKIILKFVSYNDEFYDLHFAKNEMGVKRLFKGLI